MSSISDRIKIMRKAAWPDFQLSIQFILNWYGGERARRGGALHIEERTPGEGRLSRLDVAADGTRVKCRGGSAW
jgi:hypothetical protein